MKREITAALLSVILCAGLLTGCGGTSQSSGQQETLSEEEQSDRQAVEESADAGTKESTEISSQSQNSLLGDLNDREGVGSSEEETARENGADSADPAAGAAEQDQDSASTQTDPGEIQIGSTLNGAQYVLIYDPLIYDEQDPQQMITVTSLDTGVFLRRLSAVSTVRMIWSCRNCLTCSHRISSMAALISMSLTEAVIRRQE